jgi:lysophospholipase L1-like esterase
MQSEETKSGQSSLGRMSPPRALFLMAVIVFFNLLLLEGLSRIYFRFVSKMPNYDLMFQPHPYLAAVPAPGISAGRSGIRISHNSSGFRGPELDTTKRRDRTRIVALGGSSTYCVSITDDATWPYLLEKKLGPGFEVVNLGVPGYTTVENLIQTAFWLPDLTPKIAIYYLGWNDARNLHIRNLKPDYSDFHGVHQREVLQADKGFVDRFATVRLIKKALYRPFRRGGAIPDEKAFTAEVDPRALELYGRNLKSIGALCHAHGIEAIFVPQLVNRAVLTNETSYGWLPFVKDKDLPAMIDAYNRQMQAIANQLNLPFADEVIKQNFQPADFIDQGHFSPSGTAKFAEALTARVRTLSKNGPK